MRLCFYIVFVLSLSSYYSTAQTPALIREMLATSDSVVLLSYDELDLDAEENDNKTFHLVFIPGKVDDYHILERTVLRVSDLDSLSIILERTFQDDYESHPRCFTPHHAIFVYRKGITSYLDLCFTCFGYQSSADLAFLGPFDMKKWLELMYYFYGKGFRTGFDELIDI